MKKFNEFTEAYVGQAVNSADKKTIKTIGPDGKPYFKQVAAKRNLTQEETQLDEIQVNWSHSTQKYHTIKHPDGSHYGVFDHGTYGTKGHEIRKIKDSDGNVVKAKDSRKQGDRYKSGMGSPSEAAKSWTKKYGGTILNHKLKEEAEYDEDIEMTRSELRIAINSAKEILDMMDDGVEIERWQISEIVTASDSLSTVYQNLYADNMDDEEEYDSEEDYA